MGKYSREDIIDCAYRGRSMQKMDLSGSQLSDAWLNHCHFLDCDLRRTDFSGADLKNACFVNANVSGANFTYADLTNCDFTNAIIDGADFTGAKFQNVKSRNLRGTPKNLPSSTLIRHRSFIVTGDNQ